MEFHCTCLQWTWLLMSSFSGILQCSDDSFLFLCGQQATQHWEDMTMMEFNCKSFRLDDVRLKKLLPLFYLPLLIWSHSRHKDKRCFLLVARHALFCRIASRSPQKVLHNVNHWSLNLRSDSAPHCVFTLLIQFILFSSSRAINFPFLFDEIMVLISAEKNLTTSRE